MDKTKRILVLGDSQSGKTSLLQNFFSFDHQFKNISKTENDAFSFEHFQHTYVQEILKDLQVDQQPVDATPANATIGCRIHSHLLNNYYPLLPNSTHHFLELQELGGGISTEGELAEGFIKS